MVKKNQLDYFILKEASKYINEEENDFINKNLAAQDEAIEQAEKRLEDKKEQIKQLETKKKMHQDAISKMYNPIDRSIETLQSKKFDERLKTAKDEESDLKSKIDDLKKAKSDSQKMQESVSGLNDSSQKVNKPKPKPKKREMVVRFDTNTPTPFTVKFTSRGFVVGNTRLSFETIEKAISKQFSITLKTGLVLTPVKMQKILKYKNRY